MTGTRASTAAVGERNGLGMVSGVRESVEGRRCPSNVVLRSVLLIALLTTLLAGCATLTAPSTMTSEADRCRRYGGGWDGHTCKVGAP